jgi:hypothetical protein
MDFHTYISGRWTTGLLEAAVPRHSLTHIDMNNSIEQPFSIFLLWRNPWNNFQVSGNPCIKIIISTAHGTLAWSVSCRYNNTIITDNALLSRELYFSVDLFILANKFKKRCLFFFSITISRGTPSDNPSVPRNPGWETLPYSTAILNKPTVRRAGQGIHWNLKVHYCVPTAHYHSLF